jgi:hypothetical protein
MKYSEGDEEDEFDERDRFNSDDEDDEDEYFSDSTALAQNTLAPSIALARSRSLNTTPTESRHKRHISRSPSPLSTNYRQRTSLSAPPPVFKHFVSHLQERIDEEEERNEELEPYYEEEEYSDDGVDMVMSEIERNESEVAQAYARYRQQSQPPATSPGELYSRVRRRLSQASIQDHGDVQDDQYHRTSPQFTLASPAPHYQSLPPHPRRLPNYYPQNQLRKPSRDYFQYQTHPSRQFSNYQIEVTAPATTLSSSLHHAHPNYAYSPDHPGAEPPLPRYSQQLTPSHLSGYLSPSNYAPVDQNERYVDDGEQNLGNESNLEDNENIGRNAEGAFNPNGMVGMQIEDSIKVEEQEEQRRDRSAEPAFRKKLSTITPLVIPIASSRLLPSMISLDTPIDPNFSLTASFPLNLVPQSHASLVAGRYNASRSLAPATSYLDEVINSPQPPTATSRTSSYYLQRKQQRAEQIELQLQQQRYEEEEEEAHFEHERQQQLEQQQYQRHQQHQPHYQFSQPQDHQPQRHQQYEPSQRVEEQQYLPHEISEQHEFYLRQQQEAEYYRHHDASKVALASQQRTHFAPTTWAGSSIYAEHHP